MEKFICLLLVVLSGLLTSVARGQNKPATKEEESVMLGRVLGAVEDVGAGEHPPVDQRCSKEALGKPSGINKDIEKRHYSDRLRWLAHHWYGRAPPILETQSGPCRCLRLQKKIALPARRETHVSTKRKRRKTPSFFAKHVRSWQRSLIAGKETW